MQVPIYEATSTVIVDAQSPNVLSVGVGDVVNLGERNWWAYRDYIETQREIIKSRQLAYTVIKNLNLSDDKKFRGKDDPVDTLLEKLEVELVRDTRILKIRVCEEDPKQASLIANEFAKVYAEFNRALKTSVSSEAHLWLKEEVEKEKKKMTKSELALQVYKEKSDVVSIENKRNTINDALVTLNNSYLEAQKRRIQFETAYKNLIGNKETMSLENLPAPLVDNKNLQQLKDDYRKQETLMAEYVKVYKNKHPKMIQLIENINYLKSRIKSEIDAEYNNALNDVKTSYDNALQEEGTFKIALEEQKKRALELDRKGIKYNALVREVETSDRILQILLNRLKETSIESQTNVNNVRIQDLAEIPRKPIRPKKALNIALSIILGLGGGVGLAFFREYMDITLKDPSEIANLLQMPILGSVSRVRIDGKNIKKTVDIDRIVEKDPYSLAAESYRTIRTNLLFSITNSSPTTSIVVTSSVPREGKTLTAVNLATMIANGGEKVLLVDCDVRKPRIHTIFNLDNKVGLSHFLLGKSSIDEIINYSGIDNLYLITSGGTINRSTELISLRNMKLFMEKVSLQFSTIIFDTPPVTLVTDAAVLSSIVTGVVLVAGGNRATKELLSKAKELLQNVNAKMFGIILNNILPSEDIYSYPKYYYGKYYRDK